jgi:hypothetical protein
MRGGFMTLCEMFPIECLQQIYDRIDVDLDYVYETEFVSNDQIGFAKIKARYDSDREEIHIERHDPQINSSVRETWISLSGLRDALRDHKAN